MEQYIYLKRIRDYKGGFGIGKECGLLVIIGPLLDMGKTEAKLKTIRI